MITELSMLFFKIALLSFLLGVNTKCGQLKSNNSAVLGIENRISLDHIGPPEPSYCVAPTVYSSNFTINGSAVFQHRPVERTSTFKGLGAVSSTSKPIRFAEFVVIDNVGSIVQCGETDINGNFSFEAPATNQVYRLQIRSRADNIFFKASVLRSPESNEVYTLDKAFSASADQTFDLVAKATGSLLGGAFYILDEIYSYNEKLRQLAGICPGVSTGCVPFAVAPKVLVYWEKGFNPGSYLPGSPTSSFYYKGLGRLFLLGGVNGDVDFTDTDHFDSSIIAHEYFHFLEDIYSRSDSPGGSHNGNELIDPRLAWSEGVAQFFQSVMTGITRVLDTVGNVDGASQLIVDYSVEIAENDFPSKPGEGEFREFSVARLLWDLYDDTPGETSSALACSSPNLNTVQDKCAKDGFIQFWSVITGAAGLNGPRRFISASLFHQLHNTITAGPEQNLVPLRIFEKQFANRTSYGTRLASCGAPTNFGINTPYVSNGSNNFLSSHLSANNRYFYIQHFGGTLAVQLDSSITTSNGLSGTADFYVYPEEYTLGGTSPIAANTSNSTSKAVNITTSLAAGFYMIVVNVRDFNSGTGSINVNLQAGANLASLGNLCVSP